jgi:hypothetical protein
LAIVKVSIENYHFRRTLGNHFWHIRAVICANLKGDTPGITVMSSANKAIIAALLFLAIQFVSMVGGIEFIASAQDLDNIDDMSLEDVVPLDPYLTGPVGESVNLKSPVKALCVLVYLLLPRPVVATLKPTLYGTASGLRCQGHNLWLLNRVLLI